MRNFEYINPDSLKEASKVLTGTKQANLPWAGGTDLLGMMKDGIIAPDGVVNLKNIPGMDKIVYTAGKGMTIGALVTVTDVSEHPEVLKKYPVLAQAAKEVASPQLRNQGTIGGNICQRPRCWYFRGDVKCLRKGGDDCFAVDGENKFHCVIGGGPCFIVHPSDTAVALLALDATLTIFSKKKSRQVPIKDFFILPEKDVMKENILEPGDIVTHIHIPSVYAGKPGGYIKIKERGAWDFATVSAAVVLDGDKSRINSGRFVFGGVAPIPWLEKAVTAGLNGLVPNEVNLEQLAAKALTGAEPMEHNAYKVTLARNLVKKLIAQLVK